MMSIITPEIEIVDRSEQSIRYLEHGWPTDLCRWHSHDEYELHLIIATRGKAFVGDYIGEFRPGSFFMTGPNLPHNWVTDKSRKDTVDVRDMLVQFDHRSIEQLMSAFPEFRDIRALLELSQSGVEFKGFDAKYARNMLAEIRDLRGAERILKFLTLLSELSEHADKKALSVVKLTQAQGNQKQVRIGEVVDHVVRNYAHNISVADAAKMAGMSEASFSRNFQSVTGNRFTEFVNRVRIGEACVLLFESDEQVSSICFDVGFQNLANFNRHFLAMKGMTPSEYRHMARSRLAPQNNNNNGEVVR